MKRIKRNATKTNSLILLLDNFECYLLKFIIDIDTVKKIISIIVSKQSLIPENAIIVFKGT